MKCPYCQREIADNSFVCIYCKKDLRSNETPSTQHANQSQPMPKQDVSDSSLINADLPRSIYNLLRQDSNCHNLDDLTEEQFHYEINNGGRFVHFPYCVSIFVMSFIRYSDVFFIKSGESTSDFSLKYTIISLLAGWWGFPFGIIFTLWALYVNCTGGEDITKKILKELKSNQAMSPTNEKHKSVATNDNQPPQEPNMPIPQCQSQLSSQNAIASPPTSIQSCCKDFPQNTSDNTPSMETIQKNQSSTSAQSLSKPDSLPDNLKSIWTLPDAELASAYHSSLVLRVIGMIMYILPVLFILPVFSPEMLMGCLFVIGFYVLFFYPTAYVLRNVRSLKAQKRLSHIAVFSEICGGITVAILFALLVIIGVEDAYRAGFIAGVLLFIIISMIIVLYVHRHIKNKYIFTDNPFSHAELKYVRDHRRQALVYSSNYPAKYSYGILGKTAMFLCPLWYIIVLSIFLSGIGEILQSLPQMGNTGISQADVQYAEDCLKQGNAAFEAKDYAKAVDNYDKAAQLGHPEARLNLGIIYAEGLAGTTDYDKAFSLLSNKEIIVSPMAKYYLGLLYYTGHGTQQDFKQAGQFLEASAQAGFKPAQDFLGYKDGNQPDYGMPLEDVLKSLWSKQNK